MSAYMITYFISDTTGHNHVHDENCGCGGDHSHSHEKEDCECGEDHAHSHEKEDCGCGEDHSHSDEPVYGEAHLIGKIKSLGAWAQFLPQGFFVKTTSSADEIFAEVSSVANKGDLIFVTKIDAKSSAFANQAVLDWLAQ